MFGQFTSLYKFSADYPVSLFKCAILKKLMSCYVELVRVLQCRKLRQSYKVSSSPNIYGVVITSLHYSPSPQRYIWYCHSPRHSGHSSTTLPTLTLHTPHTQQACTVRPPHDAVRWLPQSSTASTIATDSYQPDLGVHQTSQSDTTQQQGYSH